MTIIDGGRDHFAACHAVSRATVGTTITTIMWGRTAMVRPHVNILTIEEVVTSVQSLSAQITMHR